MDINEKNFPKLAQTGYEFLEIIGEDKTRYLVAINRDDPRRSFLDCDSITPDGRCGIFSETNEYEFFRIAESYFKEKRGLPSPSQRKVKNG